MATTSIAARLIVQYILSLVCGHGVDWLNNLFIDQFSDNLTHFCMEIITNDMRANILSQK